MANPLPSDPIAEGIAALQARLDSGSDLLQAVDPRPDEVVSFDYPLPPDFEGIERTLQLGFTADFPRAPLRVRISPDAWLKWPHVMKRGVCLFGDERPLNATPQRAVETVMDRVRDLIKLVVAGSDPIARQAAFDREIATYWAQQITLGPTQVVLLNEPPDDRALVTLSDPRPRAAGAPPTVWASHDKGSLAELARRVGSPGGRPRRPAEAGYYQRLRSLPKVAAPSVTTVAAWLRDCCDDSAAGIASWLGSTRNLPERHLVLALPVVNAPRQHVVLSFRDRGLTKRASPNYGKRACRAHRVELPLADAELVRSQIQVLSRDSIHSRNARSAAALSDKRAVMVGAGSLGSQVAAQLARAGVRHLTVIDPDVLNAENLSRHVLGLDDLGRPKAYALRDRLMKDVPSVEVTPIFDYVESESAATVGALDDADVVLVTTADWSSELSLLQRKRDGAPWTLIQAWSEPHAVAGHALMMPGPEACDATAMFDAAGRFHFEATLGWPNDGFVDQPQCGARFIPAGPVGLAAISSMVSQAAIDVLEGKVTEPAWYRYRAGGTSLTDAGGRWADAAPDLKGEVLQLDWPRGTGE